MATVAAVAATEHETMAAAVAVLEKSVPHQL